MKCQKGKVTQYACQRKAVVERVVRKGYSIWLCKKCDEAFGDVIGPKKTENKG